MTFTLHRVEGTANNASTAARDHEAAGRKRLKLILLCAVLVSLPLIWRWTPLEEWVNLQTILQWQRSLRDHPAAPFYVIAAYLIGGLVFFPITILSLATVFAFGPFWGNIYGFIGWVLSALQGYFLGWLMGSDLLHKLAGARFRRLLNRVQHHGFLTVLVMRVLPLAPFSLVNMFVGASGIALLHFILASLVGRLPGVITLTLFGTQLEHAIRKPGLISYALLVAAIVLAVVIVPRLLRRTLRRRRLG